MAQIRKAPITERQKLPEGRTIVDMAFASIGVLVVAWPLSVGCIQMEGPWLPDVAAASSISAAHPRGRLVSWFNWGEYAIWHFGPALKVSADGRRETSVHGCGPQSTEGCRVRRSQGPQCTRRNLSGYAWLPQVRGSDLAKSWFRAPRATASTSTRPLSFVAVRQDLPRVPEVAIGSAGCFPAP